MDIKGRPRKKIAIIHTGFAPGGGSEACILWAAEALKKDYNITLISRGEINLELLNRCYGTNLKENEINIIALPQPRLFKLRFNAIRVKLPKFCKKIAPKFDIMFSAYWPMDFGKKGMQYILDLNFDEKLRKIFNYNKNFKKLIYRDSFFRRCYLGFSKILSGISEENWKNNFTIACSEWESKILKEKFGMNSVVIYPPVISDFPDIPWDRRESGFVFIGRICPEKEVDKVIKIIKVARENNLDIHLHIIGRIDTRHSQYAKFIKDLCAENKEWCFLNGELYGPPKLDFIARHKYGISGRSNEPWGIAVAEMAKAGCIVFVPDGGGQTEIVDNPNLIYNGIEDAVCKIGKVIEDQKLQNDSRRHLFVNAQKFSIENFKEGIKNAVSIFLK